MDQTWHLPTGTGVRDNSCAAGAPIASVVNQFRKFNILIYSHTIMCIRTKLGM